MVLHLRGNAPDWEGANCLGSAPRRQPGEEEVYDPWFDEEDPGPVLSICNGEEGWPVCPLRQKCLEFALYNNEKYGVWGGMSESDRKAMRKIWRWSSKLDGPRPEWVWMSHEDLQAALTEHVQAGRISRLELEEEDDDD
jgi:hypothetical protein